jgi:Ca2+-transporting ATPase
VGSGTDVAKGTSDMVILDDRFTTIVDAVASGRGLYDNIKKVVVYLLSGSFAEVVMITGSIVAGLPVAALPAQILWINLIEDAFPVMALAFDPADPENMNEPPRPKHAPLIDQEMKRMIVIKSVLANVLLFAIFYVVYRTTQNIDLARTLVFVGFGIDALFYIFAIRNLRKNIWHYHPFENKYLVGSVLFGWVALITAVHLPLFQTLLRTVPLHLGYWMLMIGFGVANLCMIEGVKVMFFRSHQKSEH